MQKRIFIFIVILFGLLTIVLAVTFFNLNHQEFLARRHHLLCESLKPGMSKDEVLSILEHVGEFTKSEGDWGNGLFVVSINFTNPKVFNRYGYFTVVFMNYKYMRAVVSHGSSNPEIICDFYQTTESITVAP